MPADESPLDGGDANRYIRTMRAAVLMIANEHSPGRHVGPVFSARRDQGPSIPCRE